MRTRRRRLDAKRPNSMRSPVFWESFTISTIRELEVLGGGSPFDEHLHGRNGAEMRLASSALSSCAAENGLRNDSAAVRSSTELGTAVATWNFLADSADDGATHGDGLGGSHTTFSALGTLGAFAFDDDLLFNVLGHLLFNVALILTTLVWKGLLGPAVGAVLEFDVLATEAEWRTAARGEDQCGNNRGNDECEMFHGVRLNLTRSGEAMQTNYDGSQRVRRRRAFFLEHGLSGPPQKYRSWCAFQWDGVKVP